ncbi:hypothetical protein EG329_002117 [Mollisiaceae sp. DMI_Dod_QoI]|nr:hypothetical protein EG329_002117 [Helotiales sp. DMI_Dod_QoI]
MSVILGLPAGHRAYTQLPAGILETNETSHANRKSLIASPLTQEQSAQNFIQKQCPEFTAFLDLPFELRAKIWKAALPGPRFITYKIPGGKSRPLATPLLEVCHESREEVLRWYRPLISPTGIPQYIDPEMDILFVNDSYFFTEKRQHSMDDTILKMLQHIVYPLNMLEDLVQGPGYIIREPDRSYSSCYLAMRPAGYCIEHLVDFKGLKTLTLVDLMIMVEERSKFTLIDLSTTPISDWPTREHGRLFTKDEYEHLTTLAYKKWAHGSGYMKTYLERLQEAWHDTMNALRELLVARPDGHAFLVEIKGLIEPSDPVAWDLN